MEPAWLIPIYAVCTNMSATSIYNEKSNESMEYFHEWLFYILKLNGGVTK